MHVVSIFSILLLLLLSVNLRSADFFLTAANSAVGILTAPRLLDVAAQLKRSAHAALGLAVNYAQQYQLQENGRMGLLFGRLK